MPTLTVRNLEPEVHERLRMVAASKGHSMEAEVREILSRTVREWHSKPGAVARRINARFGAIGGADDLPVSESEPLPGPREFEE